MALMTVRVVALLLVSGARGDYDNFPVKSENIDAALPIAYYEQYTLQSYSIADAHPVTGLETSDGGFVLCGKALEADATGSPREAFAVKFTGSTIAWFWKSSIPASV